ncbi:hypothetical protein EXN66_Car012064 [Channa argus]|uniref:Uncharacterized protein n=1 Tax=Channa argus TaxID=215402 RepID=A0A6G1Q1K5_CHAAH|nr:hypothetical protein EXN66_Car012064 [Channa argus]
MFICNRKYGSNQCSQHKKNRKKSKNLHRNMKVRTSGDSLFSVNNPCCCCHWQIIFFTIFLRNTSMLPTEANVVLGAVLEKFYKYEFRIGPEA